MNTLSVEVSDENGLSFELLVDGQPISRWLVDGNEGIPYWIVDDGLPTLPPGEPSADPSIRIVSVCSCGEYGCGHSRCKVREEGDAIIFESFLGDVASSGRKAQFRFPRPQYEQVSRLISEQARARRAGA